MKKSTTAVLFLLLAFALAASNISSVASAQSAQAVNLSREEIRARMVKFFGYAGLEKKAAAADVDRMVELWSAAARPDLSADERTAAFRDLFLQYMRLQGSDYAGGPQAAASLAQRAIAVYKGGGHLD